MSLEVLNELKNFKPSPVHKPYVCQYCGIGYVKEKTLAAHCCEKKRRYLAKDQKHVLMGFAVYKRFYQLTQNNKNDRTYEQFVASPYYNAFVKFGSFLTNVNPLYPYRYIDWIVTSGIKLDQWCNETVYYDYVLDLIKKESVETALTRSIETMSEWAKLNNSQWDHYFKYVSQSRAIYDIRDGKISPWLILNCNSGKQLLNNFTDEQLTLIYNVLAPDFWSRKFKKNPEDVKLVNLVIENSTL